MNPEIEKGETMNEQEEARAILDDLLSVDCGLTYWEVNFLDSVDKWEGNLTPKQIATIEKIYERRC